MKNSNSNVISILLIDDNKIDSLFIKDILENNSCNVKIIPEGQKAINFLLSVKKLPELVFLSCSLPDMSGLDIIKLINHNKINVGIVFLTTKNKLNEALEAIKLGAVDFVLKSKQLVETLPVVIQKVQFIFKERIKKNELENKVIEKEEVFLKTIFSAPWGMHFYNLNAQEQLVFIGANPAADNILGITHNNLINKTIDEAFPMLTNTEVPNEYLKIAKNGGLWQTNQITYKDENVDGVFEVTAYQSSLNQVVAIFRDITEKYKQDRQILIKNAEIELQDKEIQKQFNEYVQLIDELRQSNEELTIAKEKIQETQHNYQEIFDSTSDALFIHDTDTGKVIDVNKTTLKMFGYDNKQDVVGEISSNIFATDHGFSEERAKKMMSKTNKTEANTFEWLAKKKNGDLLWVEVSLSRSRIRGVERIMASVRDISIRKKVQEALQESEFFFKESQRAAFIGSYKTDFIKGVWESSEILDQIFGIDKNYTKSIQGWLNIIHPDDIEMMNKYLKEDILLKHKPFNKEYRIIRKNDGEIRWVFGLGKVGIDNEGKVVSLIGTIQDITERKQQEIQLISKNEEIESISQDINERNEEIQAQNDELTGILKKLNLLNKIIKDREKILESLVNTADIGIGIINKEGRFILFNKYWYEKLGYKKNEMYQITNISITHPDDITQTKEVVRSLLNSETKTEHFEKRLLKKDGSFFWAELMVSAINDDYGNTEMIVGVMKDISKRKENEDLLRKNELQFRSVWTNSFDGMRLIDENGICILTNDAYCKMVGMNSKQLEGFNYSIIYNDTSQEKQVLSFIERFKKREIKFHFNKKVTLWNNEVKWFEVSNAYILEETNKPLLLSIFRDTTEQQIAKEALLEKQRQISTLISNLQGIVYRCLNDKDWTMEFIGGECKELTGYEAEDFLFNNKLAFNDIINFEFRELLWDKWQQILKEKQQFEHEYTITTATGEIKWVWERGRGIYADNGDVIALEGFITDVTSRIKTTSKLLEAENKYRSIFESAFEGVFQSTVDGKFITVNPAFAKMYGYEKAEDLLQSKDDITKLHYFDPENRKQFLEIMEKQSYIKGFEFQAKRKNGSVFWVYEDVRAVKDKKGKTLYFEGFCIDITKQKNSEELLIQKEIAENTAKFKQHFLANMSHEMRTPMNGIIGMIGFLMKTKLDETQLSYTETIKEASDNLLNIINNTLDLSRIEAGKIVLHPKIVNIHDISRKAKQLFKALVKQKDITFIVNYSNTLNEFIKIDEYRVNQIITNFLSNSIKFTEKGSITINYIQSMLNEKVFMKIEIIDTGIGITAEHQKILFNKFSQIDSSKTRHFEGAGLGLSICKELVVLMGGDVGLSSEKDKGSVFWFTFVAEPVTETELEKHNKTYKSEEHSSFNLNILIVEDKFVNSKILGMMLHNLGCTSEVATNGVEALKMFEENKFDMIFMDIQMPIMDGLSATLELKKRFKNVPPVIALTADAMEGDAEFYIAQGMDDYLSKPILLEALFQKIQKWVAIIDKI